ncbi:MAG: exodeoxyribonuclease V subunit beta [Rudaea sp.]|nr:exodeoxyribonuclease V subunit beta [Rudaea sp.]
MGQMLDSLRFPLWGSRLIEASAGTGKTWTIAALYVRLVLGHGGQDERFSRPLLPAEILVMTFTRAATRELSDRIRARLLEAARCFRGETVPNDKDVFLQEVLASNLEGSERKQAARRLALAAEGMDEAAVHTIDAWCQRMLREHAFDSGSLFDEELAADEQSLFSTAVRDYWRQQVYPLSGPALAAVLRVWPELARLEADAAQLIKLEALHSPQPGTLAALATRTLSERQERLAALKQGWDERAAEIQSWIDGQMAGKTKPFLGTKIQSRYYQPWLSALSAWATQAEIEYPDISDKGWFRLTPEGMQDAARDPASMPELPAAFADFAALKLALDALPQVDATLLRHAAAHIAARMDELKRRAGTFGFADLLTRLDRALAGPNGERLRERIVAQYPLALVDEFQDTSPLQYRIFDRLYRCADNAPDCGLLLIGDPKQSIYGFRGADIHSYLAARSATAGRHYALATNYRSTQALVAAVNQVFDHAAGYPRGAFRFRHGEVDPLPFTKVAAAGRKEALVNAAGPVPALTFWQAGEALNSDQYRQQFAAQCAEHIVGQLNDEHAGFRDANGQLARLKPADIAVLVRSGKEAAAVRRALQQRGVASVYLSDKDSVFDSAEAADLLRWLQAVANPLDGRLARAAYATAVADLPLAELAQFAHDDQAWEIRVEQLKRLHLIWQRQGVLAMLRAWLHELTLPARLLGRIGGERSLTNLLHLAELLQAASLKQEGEQALIRWLAEQIDGQGERGDEMIVRLESDADLVKVVTVHKSKGLEYPLVYLPFAASFRPVDKRGKRLIEFSAADGMRQIDFTLSDEALAQADEARLQEDLRLLYVALTRPRHALWLGLVPLKIGHSDKPQLQRSALGYLLGGGADIGADELPVRLAALQAGSSGVQLENVVHPAGHTLLNRGETLPPLRDSPPYAGQFERDWSIASFSALTRDLGRATGWSGENVRDEILLEAGPVARPAPSESAPWHAFPKGPIPGNFLHDQLEWLAIEGFDLADSPDFAPRLASRCDRLGWGHRKEAVVDWLRNAVTAPLPPLGLALAGITQHLPEMEFWFPAERLNSALLDTLCRTHILPGQPRPALPERTLHGMLKGFADLVFEHGGKYWVLDYKSNALGGHDADYHAKALADAMLEHRYDVQAALYLLALHRLLRQRLGEAYRPEQQLGGAVYYFLRGFNGPEQGCCFVPAPVGLLEALDGAFGSSSC